MTSTQRRSAIRKRKDVSAISPETVTFHEQEFRELVQKVQLRDLYMRETRAALVTPPEKTPTGNGELVVKPTQTRAQRIDASLLYCGVRFDIVAEAGPEFPFHVTIFAEYGLYYDIPADIEFCPDTAAVFARRNAVFNAWPFFRELVQTTVGRMGLPPVVLARFRLSPQPP